MINLTDEELTEIQELVALKSITTGQVKRMEHYIKKYIDHSVHVCTHCSAQIRFAHERLKGWYNIVVKPGLK